VFKTEIFTGESLFSFGLQQVGVWIAFMIWGLITSDVPAAFIRVGATGTPLECIAILSLVLGPGIFFGHLIRFLFPSATYSGRWIWLLPVMFLSAGLLADLFRDRLWQELADLFFPASDGEGWWAAMFFACPVLGCIGYSVGVAGRLRLSSRAVRSSTGQSPG
jgi:hypothetical protein